VDLIRVAASPGAPNLKNATRSGGGVILHRLVCGKRKRHGGCHSDRIGGLGSDAIVRWSIRDQVLHRVGRDESRITGCLLRITAGAKWRVALLRLQESAWLVSSDPIRKRALRWVEPVNLTSMEFRQCNLTSERSRVRHAANPKSRTVSGLVRVA
jgi:hypothetical protein